MKRTLIFAIILFTAFTVHAQEKVSPDAQNVQQVVSGFFQAIADRDTNAMLGYCTNDVLIIEGALLWNSDSLTLKIAQNTAVDYKRINTIEFIRTTVSGKIAWVTYSNQAEVDKNGRHSMVKWLETAILVKKGKAWKIKTLHSTMVDRK
jgi:ketosteroid isomerase-like protein